VNDPSDLEAAIFVAARRLAATQRPVYLDEACGGDAALRRRIADLLQADAGRSAILGELPPETNPATRQAAASPPGPGATMRLVFAPSEKAGDCIGRYKLLQEIGQGGCGVVYMAEQQEPVRRRVALKVIKLGMDTKQVVARFEAERQALALMDHPHIAKVLDAGATDTGRPFFVMELVRGIPVTRYCDESNLDTATRLGLFVQVCQAIQHAHQKGIIHRDIKPSNILVADRDGLPVPKVIDFGIAKATTDQPLTDKTLFTAFEQFVGTPAYMSPEQAKLSELDVDTRSDIYSLGVLLYELLSGKTPFESKRLAEAGLDEVRRIIHEEEPPRPSTRLRTLNAAEQTTLAKHRQSDPPKLVHLIKGDLDWIVMKAMEKDRARRYETANGLARDVQRYLADEPIVARPPSKLYEFQKTFRRHKAGFLATAAIIAVLAAGIVMTTWQAVRATHAKHEALAAQASEKVQRQQAVAAEKAEAAEELAARQRAYASDMNLAKQALAGSNLGRAQDLLNRQRPQTGQKDLRGWEWRYLWQQTRSDARFTLCQKSLIESLSVSADGNWLAIGLVHKDGLFVWDLPNRKEVAHLAPGEGSVRATFSPTESLMAFTSLNLPASGKQEASLRLWNTATRQTVAQIPMDGLCAGLAFSQDGRTLVTSTGSGIILWRVPEATKLASYPSEQFADFDAAPLAGFAATPDLGLVAYGTGSGQVCVMDLHDGKRLWTAPASRDKVSALALSPDGKTLASAAGYAESDIRLWDTVAGKEIGRLEGHKSWVGSLVFWPDGKKLASCSADQTIRIGDIASRKCLGVLRGARLEVWRLALLPDHETLVSGSKDGTVCVWDASVTHPRRESITWQDKIANWRFVPDSVSILTLDDQGKVTRWSGSDFQVRETLLDLTNYSGSSFSPDCRFLAVGSTNGNISVWDLSRRILRRKFKLGDGSVTPLSFLSWGNRLVCRAMADNRFSEWDLETHREIQAWPAPVRYARFGLTFGLSPDGRLAVEVGWDGDVYGRNLPGQSNMNLPLDVLQGCNLAFSADGERLALASTLGFAQVWNIATWRKEATLVGFLNGVCSVAFSQDGERLATGGTTSGDSVKLWDVDSWQELLTLEGAGSLFDLTAFSPDGNAIGTRSRAGILRVWRAPSWEEIKAMELNEKTDSKQP